jgi:hypothetical protein
MTARSHRVPTHPFIAERGNGPGTCPRFPTQILRSGGRTKVRTGTVAGVLLAGVAVLRGLFIDIGGSGGLA